MEFAVCPRISTGSLRKSEQQKGGLGGLVANALIGEYRKKKTKKKVILKKTSSWEASNSPRITKKGLTHWDKCEKDILEVPIISQLSQKQILLVDHTIIS